MPVPEQKPRLIYLGGNRQVRAIDPETGAEVWKKQLPPAHWLNRGTSFVTLLLQGDALFAVCSGRLYRFDPLTGATHWIQEIPEFRYSIVSFGTTGPSEGAGFEQIHAAESAFLMQTAINSGAVS